MRTRALHNVAAAWKKVWRTHLGVAAAQALSIQPQLAVAGLLRGRLQLLLCSRRPLLHLEHRCGRGVAVGVERRDFGREPVGALLCCVPARLTTNGND